MRRRRVVQSFEGGVEAFVVARESAEAGGPGEASFDGRTMNVPNSCPEVLYCIDSKRVMVAVSAPITAIYYPDSPQFSPQGYRRTQSTNASRMTKAGQLRGRAGSLPWVPRMPFIAKLLILLFDFTYLRLLSWGGQMGADAGTYGGYVRGNVTLIRFVFPMAPGEM
jgi:hypothetical protein